MSTALVSDAHSAFDLPTRLPQPFVDLPHPRPGHDVTDDTGSFAAHAIAALSLDLPASRPTAALSGDGGNSRTITHVYEPVRDDQNEVIDFRLTFDQASAHEARRPFLGIQMVRTGEWAAPGAIFHSLKRVLLSGHSLHEMSRHVGDDEEVCFYQTANRVGDTIVTTTSIVVMPR